MFSLALLPSVDPEAPIETQQQRCRFDLLIHKASDWIAHRGSEFRAELSLPNVFASLATAGIPYLDPVASTLPVLTRVEMSEVLGGLVDLDGGFGRRLRLPATAPLAEGAEVKTKGPFIIKSNAACGVSFSHKMVRFEVSFASLPS